jgi:hypothetical protein
MPPCDTCGHDEEQHDCCPHRCLDCRTGSDASFHPYDPGPDEEEFLREGMPEFNGAFGE